MFITENHIRSVLNMVFCNEHSTFHKYIQQFISINKYYSCKTGNSILNTKLINIGIHTKLRLITDHQQYGTMLYF